ncbi:MAG: DUF4020 domain-containing protein [Burkholderiales bacterium]|nr:DUF4020 domain-containing protein [Burkholderiales bacterium]
MSTRLGQIDFDERVLDALRDGCLVVFAGAGVSKGLPADLPNFKGLVHELAKKAGKEWKEKDEPDQFLGQLNGLGIPVHQLAADVLDPPGRLPNALHKDLLRLFRTPDKVRLVTTNFDRHFEAAALEVFGQTLECHCAPALPLGDDFQGLIKLHGTVARPRGMVLTDADFGRAYLTQAWAARFLLQLFQRYTVLFVGYSHEDLVVSYLARALPPNPVAGRFALDVRQAEGEHKWRRLGIQLLSFPPAEGADSYRHLYEAVARLAQEANYGVLDWEAKLAELGSRPPPLDDQECSLIERGLRELSTTRFLLKAMRDARWPTWLHARGHLNSLYQDGPHEERTEACALWLASSYARHQPQVLLGLLAQPGARMGSRFWWHVCRALAEDLNQPMDCRGLLQLWPILLHAVPDSKAAGYGLMCMAERAHHDGHAHLVLDAFLALCRTRLVLEPGWQLDDEGGGEDAFEVRIRSELTLRGDHWALSTIWQKYLQPRLYRQAEALLLGLASALNEMHRQQSALWARTPIEPALDYGVRTVAPGEHDRYHEPQDVLIDAARDALAHLAKIGSPTLDGWLATWVNADAPWLRRIALYGMAEHPHRSAEQRMAWWLERCEWNDECLRTEAEGLLAKNYAQAGPSMRSRFVDGVMSHREAHEEEATAVLRTAYVQLGWLDLLCRTKPDCEFAVPRRVELLQAHPEYLEEQRQSEAFSRGGWHSSPSPWTVETLLGRPAHEWLDELLSFQTESFWGPSRSAGLEALREAVSQNAQWGLDLGQALVRGEHWASDLWPPLFKALGSSVDVMVGRQVLAWAARTELQQAQAKDHSHAIADWLFWLVANGGKPFARDLLDEAHAVGEELWPRLREASAVEEKQRNWLSEAINRPAGQLMEFWLRGLALQLQGKEGLQRQLPDRYRRCFERALADPGRNGGLARTMLAGEAGFLFGLAPQWASQHVLPLFTAADDALFDQAWDGFLSRGRLSAGLGDALVPAFRVALPRFFQPRRTQQRVAYVRWYTGLLAFRAKQCRDDLLAHFFGQAEEEDRTNLAHHVGTILRRSPEARRLELWRDWLQPYWEGRISGLPRPLLAAEVGAMVEWLDDLQEGYPEAVDCLVRSPAPELQHCDLLFTLRESALATTYQAETALLLAHLSIHVQGHERSFLREVADRLTALTPAQRRVLEAALRAVGV